MKPSGEARRRDGTEQSAARSRPPPAGPERRSRAGALGAMRGRRTTEQARVSAGLPDAAAAEAHVAGDGATTGARVFGGGIWKMLSNALPQIYTLILSVAAARDLGPSGMGRQSFI